jgi:hypothetical protein
VAVLTASIRTFPERACCTPVMMLSKIIATCPLAMSGIASPVPL